MSLIFTVIALLNTILLSPVVAAFYFSGYEVMVWSHLPWPNLLIAAALSLGEETNVPEPVDRAIDNYYRENLLPGSTNLSVQLYVSLVRLNEA